MEELLVKAIKGDHQAQHSVKWKEAGHDDLADLEVSANGEIHLLEIKSGKPVFQGSEREAVDISGHRLGRFHGDLRDITNYLRQKSSQILAVPGSRVDDERGRTHHYQVSYLDPETFKPENDISLWTKKGTMFHQTNRHGTVISLRPSMSWQVWWRVPIGLFTRERILEIN